MHLFGVFDSKNEVNMFKIHEQQLHLHHINYSAETSTQKHSQRCHNNRQQLQIANK